MFFLNLRLIYTYIKAVCGASAIASAIDLHHCKHLYFRSCVCVALQIAPLKCSLMAGFEFLRVLQTIATETLPCLSPQTLFFCFARSLFSPRCLWNEANHLCLFAYVYTQSVNVFMSEERSSHTIINSYGFFYELPLFYLNTSVVASYSQTKHKHADHTDHSCVRSTALAASYPTMIQRRTINQAESITGNYFNCQQIIFWAVIMWKCMCKHKYDGNTKTAIYIVVSNTFWHR